VNAAVWLVHSEAEMSAGVLTAMLTIDVSVRVHSAGVSVGQRRPLNQALWTIASYSSRLTDHLDKLDTTITCRAC